VRWIAAEAMRRRAQAVEQARGPEQERAGADGRRPRRGRVGGADPLGEALVLERRARPRAAGDDDHVGRGHVVERGLGDELEAAVGGVGRVLDPKLDRLRDVLAGDPGRERERHVDSGRDAAVRRRLHGEGAAARARPRAVAGAVGRLTPACSRSHIPGGPRVKHPKRSHQREEPS
jgi:hypothetical protein